MAQAAAIGGTVAQAGLSILSGFGQRAQMRSEAKAAQYEARVAELRGKQVSANETQRLNEALSAIESIRAGRNVGADSATGAAIREDRRRKSAQQENVGVLSERLDAVSKRNRARALKNAGDWAVVGGFGEALGTLTQAASGGVFSKKGR